MLQATLAAFPFPLNRGVPLKRWKCVTVSLSRTRQAHLCCKLRIVSSGAASCEISSYPSTPPHFSEPLPRTIPPLFLAQFHFSKLDLFMSYVCVSGVTFGSALIMALIVESPLTKLGRYLEHAIKPRERCGVPCARVFV